MDNSLSKKAIEGLEAARKEAKASQAKIAKKIGVERETLNRQVSKGDMKLSRACNYAAALGMRLVLVPDDDRAAALMSGRLLEDD